MERPNYNSLFLELMIRGRFIMPQNDLQSEMFEEGTDIKKCPDFFKRIMDAAQILQDQLI